MSVIKHLKETTTLLFNSSRLGTPSVLEVPTINWATYIGVKSVKYIKMGHASRIQAIEPNNWKHENTVRETKNEFATDLQLILTQTTNDPKLLKDLVCLENTTTSPKIIISSKDNQQGTD